MEENREKELEQFIKKVVCEVGLEQPSPDFNDVVFSKIRSISENGTSPYKPLISRPAWIGISTAIAIVFIYVILENPTLNIGQSAIFRFHGLTTSDFLVDIPNFDISDIFVYAFLGLALFMGIQIFILKHRFERRLWPN